MDLKQFKTDSTHLVLSAERIQPETTEKQLLLPTSQTKLAEPMKEDAFKVPVFKARAE
jgi:hypothetical protein